MTTDNNCIFIGPAVVLSAFKPPITNDAKVFRLDGVLIVDELTLFSSLNDACLFPSYFGNNWNAVEDCLGDLAWVPSEGYMIIWTSASNLLVNSPQTFITFLDVIRSTSKWWRRSGKAFDLLIADDLVCQLASTFSDSKVLH